MKKQKLLGWARDIVLFGAVFVGISAFQSRNMLDSDGSVAIDSQQLVSLQGEAMPLTQPGKRTLVYFFAPWCNVCALSIGNLGYLNDDNLNVVRVALDYSTVNEVQAFVSRNDVEGQVLLGTDQHKQAFQIHGYPSYYLLDENSKVVASSFGYSSALGLKLNNYLNRDSAAVLSGL